MPQKSHEDSVLAHIRWTKREHWYRVSSMPCIMRQQLPYVNNKYNGVFIAFGFKAKPLGRGVEFIYAAAFKVNGKWLGWNWTFTILRANEAWCERLVYITDRHNQFCYEAPIRYFNVTSGGKIREDQITDVWRVEETIEKIPASVGDWFVVTARLAASLTHGSSHGATELQTPETETFEIIEENLETLENFEGSYDQSNCRYDEIDSTQLITLGQK